MKNCVLKSLLGISVLMMILVPAHAQLNELAGFEIEAPTLSLRAIPFEIRITAVDADGNHLEDYDGNVVVGGIFPLEGGRLATQFAGGSLTLNRVVFEDTGKLQISVQAAGVTAIHETRVIPGYCSLLPPLVAIALALIFRQVVVALFSGIWLGSFFLFENQVIASFFHVLDYFIVSAMTEKSHVQIILFSLLFGGMVGVITKNGGAKGIANLITRYAKTARGGQVAAWAMAFFLFFDDYANVLVRGNLMRPITDRLRVSREKLAFIVDAGAATVASIFIISTWIGYEVGLIEQGLRMIGSTESAYTVFVKTIPYRFYPILVLVLTFFIAWTGRDLGPMLHAERRARREGKVLRDGAEPATDLSETGGNEGDDVPARWVNGFLPVIAILFVGLYGIWLTGTESLVSEGIKDYGVGDIVSRADSYVALLWASLAGCIVAILLTLGQRLLSLTRTIEAWVLGLKSMVLAMLILVLAWSLGAVTEELQTADYLVHALRGVLSPFWLPALTFVVAAVVAFSTGTSWATMAIMMPLVIPLAHTLSVDAALTAGDMSQVLLGVISSVLAGAVFGDHCSPISDTTILSSMSSACDHIDHVRTQLPYALIAAGVGIVVGDIPTAYGMSPWISIFVGSVIMIGILFLFGKKVDEEANPKREITESMES